MFPSVLSPLSASGAMVSGYVDESPSRKRPASRCGFDPALNNDVEYGVTPKKFALPQSRSGFRWKDCDIDNQAGKQARRWCDQRDVSPLRGPPGGYDVDDDAFGGPPCTSAPLKEELEILSMFGLGDDPLDLLYLEPGSIVDSNAMASLVQYARVVTATEDEVSEYQLLNRAILAWIIKIQTLVC